MHTEPPTDQIAEAREEIRARFNLSDAQVTNVMEWLLENNDLDDDVELILYSWYMDSGDMPYGVAKARTGDPQEWIGDRMMSDFGLN